MESKHKEELELVLPRGELSAGIIQILKSAGYDFDKGSGASIDEKKLPFTYQLSDNESILKVVSMKPRDIPSFMEKSRISVGVCPFDNFAEKTKASLEGLLDRLSNPESSVGAMKEAIDKTGFAPLLVLPYHVAGLYLMSFGDWGFKSVKELQQKYKPIKISTEYPHIVNEFLKEKKAEACLREITGSPETYVLFGFDHATVDIIQKGSRIQQYHLSPVELLTFSTPWLIANKEKYEENKDIITKLINKINNKDNIPKKEFKVIEPCDVRVDDTFTGYKDRFVVFRPREKKRPDLMWSMKDPVGAPLATFAFKEHDCLLGTPLIRGKDIPKMILEEKGTLGIASFHQCIEHAKTVFNLSLHESIASMNLKKIIGLVDMTKIDQEIDSYFVSSVQAVPVAGLFENIIEEAGQYALREGAGAKEIAKVKDFLRHALSKADSAKLSAESTKYAVSEYKRIARKSLEQNISDMLTKKYFAYLRSKVETNEEAYHLMQWLLFEYTTLFSEGFNPIMPYLKISPPQLFSIGLQDKKYCGLAEDLQNNRLVSDYPHACAQILNLLGLAVDVAGANDPLAQVAAGEAGRALMFLEEPDFDKDGKINLDEFKLAPIIPVCYWYITNFATYQDYKTLLEGYLEQNPYAMAAGAKERTSIIRP